MFYIILSHAILSVVCKFLKLECDVARFASCHRDQRQAVRYISHYDVHIHIRSRTKEYRSLWAQEGAGGGKREDNLLCCQYVAHNDRLLDFSDMAIIVAADLDRSSLA